MHTRPRILLTTDAVGGVWTYTLELAAALSRQSDLVVIIATLGPAPSPEQVAHAVAIPGVQLADTDLPLDWLAKDEAEVRSAAAGVARIAERAQIDIAQVHTPALAVADYPVPVISVVHSCVATWWSAVKGTAPLPSDFLWRAKLVREGMRRSAMTVAPSQAFAAALQQAYALPKAPRAIRNGRTPPNIAKPGPALDIVTVGRLWDEAKNIAFLDRVAARLEVAVGAVGPTRGPNGTSAELHHLELLGERSSAELAGILARRPLFVSPALYEPFGLSVLEAAQAGCPLVLADIATFRELWSGAALFFDPRDEESCARAIKTVLNDPAERERLGAAARHRSQSYSPDATAAAMLRCYETLLRVPEEAAA